MSQDTDLLWLVIDVGRMVRIEADRRASAYGMSRAQWAMLARLDRQPGLSQKELADALEVEPITVARLADRLEAQELLERRPDPGDRRIWRLHLLPGASTMLARLAIERDEMAASVTGSVDTDKLDEVERALTAMRAALSRRGAVAQPVAC